MAQELEQQLKEVGSKLENFPSSKDSLLKLLKQATKCLSELDQSPPASMLESMQPFLDAVVKPELLKHQDRDVKLLVATCICEITRITAPEAPYSDDVLKDIFHLIVGTFGGLHDTAGPSFGRRVVILETLAKYRSCVVMLDLECYDLVNEMFRTFLDVASDDHPESVLSSMQTIMVVLIEESEEIQDDILCHILTKLGRNKTDTSNAARKLAMNVIEQCAGKLEADIKKLLISSISGDSEPVKYQIDYHEVIYDLYHCAPQILSGFAPYLTGELLSDQLDTRLKAVSLVGDLFALPGSTISEAFKPIFSEFLKRLTDRVVTVRMSVLEHVKTCLLSNTFRPEAPEIISALCDRLLDFEETVRKQVVAVICDVASHDLSSISLDTVKLVAERIRDKSLLVKKYTMERLAEIYRVYCVKLSDGSVKCNEYDWIPGKILRCFFDKDFRSDTIESLIYGSLFPTEFTIKEKVQHWIRVFSGFDSIEVKALEKIMEQKQRLQQEMQRYLSLRQTYQLQDGDAPEVQKKVLFCFRIMSRSYADLAKAEENFQFLDQLKDVNVWKILTGLVDPNTSFHQACTFREDLLKILGEKHRLYEFLSSLSMKISYLLFNKEHVKELLSEVATQKSTGNSQYASSSMSILVILARFSPMLFSGTEEVLLNFLKDGDETIKEGVLHVLAKAGGTIREQLAVSTSSIDLILEKVCLEGSRKQAKYAVHALAAITKDDGLKSLSVLYKKLVDMLDEKTHLPAVLQSLGCIAQTAMPVFETRETEIEEFIVDKILKRNDKEEGEQKASWSNRSETCLLKIYGIKTLVKSFLPVKDANVRPGIDGLLEILRNMLSLGEISKDIESSSVDKAHLRLASAKAILRLSKLWDNKIPLDIFHLTLRTSEISFPEPRRMFLSKVHQYIKDRHLDGKYACAFLLNIFGSNPSEFQEDKQNLSDIIQMYQQTKARQVSIQSDANSSAVYPESMLPYLVHILAHHSCPDVDECKDLDAYEVLYRQLYMILSMMVHKDEDSIPEASNNIWKDTILAIIYIFHNIKQSEDVLDAAKSKSSHAICDLGLSIIKRLAPKEYKVQGSTAPASLPSILYKKSEKKEGDDSAIIKNLRVWQVNEIQVWLVDESSLAHFESLKLETTETLDAETAEEVKPGEPDGNDVPIGKIIKNIRSQGSKGKKSKRDNSSPVEGVNAENAVDVIQMVREINLDNLGQSTKFESSNGHDHSPIPKRKRSSAGHSASRLVTSSPLTDTRGDREKSGARNRLDFSVSRFQKKASALPKHKRKGSEQSRADASNEVETSDDESPKVIRTDKTRTANEFSTGSGKKRKRSLLPGLVKCKNKDGEKDTEDLIGCRIKIWWPIDKRFYTGTVKSYDTSKMKHVILYDDGDVEILRLEKERWEVIDKNRKSVKKLTPSKPFPSKDISPVKAKNSGGLKQNKKPIKPVKGKRTPNKASTQRRKDISKNNHREGEEKESSDLSNAEPTTTSKVDEDEINLGSSEGEHDEKMDENVTDEQESDKEAKPLPKRKKLKGKDASPEPMELDEERPDSGEQLGKDTEHSSEDDQKTEDEKQQHSAEADDNVGDSSEASGEETKEEDKMNSEDDQVEEERAKEEEKSDSEESQPEQATSEKSESEDDQGAQSKDKEKSGSEEEKQEADDVSHIPVKPEKSEEENQNHSDVGEEDEMSDDEPLMVWKNRVVKKGSKRVR